MITKNGKDVPVSELTAENYRVPAGEEKLYHCVIEVVQFDPKTGKRLSTPRVQKFGRKTFETLVYKTLKKQGYEVKILHNPTGWEETAAKRRAEADKAKFDAAVAASVEAILAKRDAEAKAAAEAEAKIAAEKDAEIARLKEELAKATTAAAEKPAETPAPEAETPAPEAEKPAKTAAKKKDGE
jgi:hypothetical protein